MRDVNMYFRTKTSARNTTGWQSQGGRETRDPLPRNDTHGSGIVVADDGSRALVFESCAYRRLRAARVALLLRCRSTRMTRVRLTFFLLLCFRSGGFLGGLVPLACTYLFGCSLLRFLRVSD